jgi:hypothetical protein
MKVAMAAATQEEKGSLILEVSGPESMDGEALPDAQKSVTCKERKRLELKT